MRSAAPAPFAGERTYWVAAEKVETFSHVYFRTRILNHTLAELNGEAAVARGGPGRAASRDGSRISARSQLGVAQKLLGLPAGIVEPMLLRLEAGGSILRGKFTNAAAGEIEWCDRRLLARIHRLTLGTLRKQIQPVTAAQFMHWLLRWQHVAPGTQLLGERGTLEALQQLQGFEAPANSWERADLGAADRELRSEDARSTVPHRERRMGPAFASSVNAAEWDGSNTAGA